MENWKANQQQDPEERSWKGIAGVVSAALLVTLIVAAVIIIRQNSRLKSETQYWTTEISTLGQTRDALTSELTTLEGEYDAQIAENTELQNDLTERVAEVESLQKKVRSAQSQLAQSKAHAEEINQRMAQLEELKVALQRDIVILTEENVALTETNAMLIETVGSTQRQVNTMSERITHLTEVNTKLNQRLAAIAPAGFVADNFKIVAHRKNDKLTAKASQANVINVAFDLRHVPENYGKTHEIYLVLTDFDGTPVRKVSTSSAQVRTADNVMQIEAADAKKINVQGDHALQMKIDPVEDLSPGHYNLIVYADNGFLGATGFQLR